METASGVAPACSFASPDEPLQPVLGDQVRADAQLEPLHPLVPDLLEGLHLLHDELGGGVLLVAVVHLHRAGDEDGLVAT